MAADIRSLTGVRGVAAVVIVIYHFGKFRLDPASSVTVWSVPHGYLPVDMFFMLSGYVIGYVYRDAFLSEPWRNYQTFLIKRVARLYPAYIVIAAFYALKIALGLTGEETFARFNGRQYPDAGWLGTSYLSADWRVLGIERGIRLLLRRTGVDEIHAAKGHRLVDGLRRPVVAFDLFDQHQRPRLEWPAGCGLG
jgi:peptidoglycan/LPS O-acetylase OafA/YrhL